MTAALVLRGQAVPFGKPTRIDLGGGLAFSEEFVPGSLLNALAKRETLAAYGHDLSTHPPLGSLRSGTLEAWETPSGLQFSLRLGASSRAADVADAVGRGDLGGVSVGFSVKRDEWSVRGTGANRLEHRRVLEVDRLFEFSLVPFPAYADTTVSVGADVGRSRPLAGLDRRLSDLDRLMAAEAARMPGKATATVAPVQRRGLVKPGTVERRTFPLVAR